MGRTLLKTTNEEKEVEGGRTRSQVCGQWVGGKTGNKGTDIFLLRSYFHLG